MGKRKRESKQQQYLLLSSPSSPPGPKSKKRRHTSRPERSSSPPQSMQATSRLGTYPPQVSQKLWSRFYEPLVLLSAFGKSQGKHVKNDEAASEENPDGGNKTLRKRFLDELAYICDYSASGDTVAAVAIQDGPQLVYWVAANTNQQSKVKPFLLSILQLLSQVYDAGEEMISTLQRQISDRTMAFAAKKLGRYRSVLTTNIQRCLPMLERQNTEGHKTEYQSASKSLKEWLISLKDSELDQPGFCHLCYQARDSEFVKALGRMAGESRIEEGHTSSGAKYARVRHFIGRLTSYIKAAWLLIEAGRSCPKLFVDYSIEIATHHPNFLPPPYRAKSSINGIINRMVSDPQACEYYQKELHSQDEKFHLTLEKRIRDEYRDPKFKLRVHAEIILLDLFHLRELRFLDGIRYIGVSKPACFLCYRYFQAHPLQVQTSGCSNNLYLQWQPPYIAEDSPASVKVQEDIMNTMIKGIRLFVLDKIIPGYRGTASHPDSTTGLGTSVYAYDVGVRGLKDLPRDSCGAPSPLPNSDESSSRLAEDMLISSGDIELLSGEASDGSFSVAADGFDEDSDDESIDDGMALF